MPLFFSGVVPTFIIESPVKKMHAHPRSPSLFISALFFINLAFFNSLEQVFSKFYKLQRDHLIFSRYFLLSNSLMIATP